MSEFADGARLASVQRRLLRLYLVISVLMLLGLGGLTVYSIALGPLVGPGVEASFGYAVALMFLMGATLVHCVDRMYRLWPFGRRVRTQAPEVITDRSLASVAKWFVLAAGAAAVAYVLGGLIGAW
ncbi:MAG: hypothetical protein L3K23_07380 [Thermoplasmata archaeon]|nr:hypothetical protein [Thermoplasmata archaeon]